MNQPAAYVLKSRCHDGLLLYTLIEGLPLSIIKEHLKENPPVTYQTFFGTYTTREHLCLFDLLDKEKTPIIY